MPLPQHHAFFCNHCQKLVVRSCSAPNSPREEWESCSEWIIWPEVSHGCANLAPDFKICQFHDCKCNFHFSSPNWMSWMLPWTVAMIALTITRFNQTIFLEVKDLSSSRPCSKTSSASRTVVKVIFQRAAHDTFTLWLSRLCIRTNHMSCLV